MSLGRRYWTLWSSFTASNLGDGLTLIGLPLLAVTLTDDARLITLVAAFRVLPFLTVGLPAGVIIDRFDRCPDQAGPIAESGCPAAPAVIWADESGDRDGDGYADSVDACPTEPEVFNGIGPGLELDLETGRFGPIGTSLYLGLYSYRVLGNRTLEFRTASSTRPRPITSV